MKKTISINISGILFHIEEDGYTNLKKYLDAINRHFSHYTDNQEIISDIENRIAEIFLSNLKNNKQVITAENVSNLIEKMGTIADFKAIEEDLGQETSQNTGVQDDNDFYKYITPPNQDGKGYKKLSRLENRKILGGVCAGLANYLAIDPLWTRLVAILLLFSGNFHFGRFGWNFFPWDINFSLGFSAVVAYIVLWVILPVSYEEPEDKNIKKLYRNPDDRTLGGVASGLAAYFSVEVIWVRLLFIGLIFAGGAGFVIYLILWIITPAAKSITERIQMKGGAITLDNIETTIKENMNPTPPQEESQGRKIIMAPFRVLGMIINGIGQALGPFGKFILEVVRVIFGLIIFFIGMAITISPIVVLGVYFGLIPPNGDIQMGDIPVVWINEFVPVWLAIAAAIVIIIPGIILILLGISVLIKKSIIDGRFGLVALGVWLLSVGVCAFQIPRVVSQFKSEATHLVEEQLTLSDGVMVLRSTPRPGENEIGNFSMVSVRLEGFQDTTVKLIQEFESRGRTYDEALKNAAEIQYTFTLKDTIMDFGRYVNLNDLSKFRAQELNMILEIPYDKPFMMDKSMLSIIKGTIHSNGYKIRDVNSRNHWVFNENGLLCLTCREDHKTSSADSLSRAKFEGFYFMNR